MGCTRREFLALASAGTVAGLAGCVPSRQTPQTPSDDTSSPDPSVDLSEFESLALDASAWRYDEDNDVYYQLGLTYCLSPATDTYESLAVFVPGAYFSAEKNGDTYTCTVNDKAVVGAFTAATAPVLMPINTGSLAAQSSPTSYAFDGLGPYMDAGCVYVYAGFRGRSAGYDTASGSDELFPGGSPWPVVDLKAAVRYLRYNASRLPCDASRVFVFGFGGGGGASAVLGASGDSELFEPYLTSIGAITHDAEGATVSDAIAGSASWCPVTSFDTADAAYEWCQGQYATDGTRAEGSWTRLLSQDLAAAYGAWVNEMDLRDADDAQLTLDETETGVYAQGSYADALLDCVNEAATTFVQGTAFPYAYTPQRLEDPTFPGDPNLAATREADVASSTPASEAPADGTGEAPATGDATAQEDASKTLAGVAQVQSTIYDSAQSYFAALNADSWWINYNHRSMSVTVSSLRDFVTRMRPAAQPASPFDLPDRSSRVNQLFGIGEESTLHFDAIAAGLIDANLDTYAACADWPAEEEVAWQEDLEKVDALETDMATRVSLMNPLFWLSGHYDGYGQASVAPHWRINEGLFDTDAPLCTAANIVFALRKYDGVASVSHTPVWGQGHVLAERSGSATSNLISWVTSCCSA
ncbi:subtype A tannase [Thermophilibacter mediterraneus]|uniref:subtype A tannase n=1 Tax=Thermophilibacter mediterraneus TaxID=1871031 RepID=UPI00235398EE|nr:subtype A tannase [Thermophilibacter mediterraneus]